MQHYNCIIVEDEPLAAEIIRDYIEQVPFLELKAICSDAIYAMEVLKHESIDLIFLDIHLPRLKGLDFLKALKVQPHVIITTAYNDYAVASYEFRVTDYLLKPVEFSRFVTAVNKLFGDTNQKQPAIHATAAVDNAHCFFNVNKKRIKVYLDDILFIESQKEYIKVYTRDKTLTTKMPLHQVDGLLADSNFLRIHRSFIVSKNNIDAFTASEVEIGGHIIPIGRSYKELVQAILR